MDVPLSRRVPRWLVFICWPARLIGPHLPTVGFLLVVFGVLHAVGVDTMTAVGWVFVAVVLATYLRSFGNGGAAAGALA